MKLAIETLNLLQESTTYVDAVKSVLDRLSEFCRNDTGRMNHWEVGSSQYFFEWPEHGETEDGSVEGSVFQQIGSTSRYIGEYHISGDGTIVEFPFLPEEIIDDLNAQETDRVFDFGS